MFRGNISKGALEMNRGHPSIVAGGNTYTLEQ